MLAEVLSRPCVRHDEACRPSGLRSLTPSQQWGRFGDRLFFLGNAMSLPWEREMRLLEANLQDSQMASRTQGPARFAGTKVRRFRQCRFMATSGLLFGCLGSRRAHTVLGILTAYLPPLNSILYVSTPSFISSRSAIVAYWLEPSWNLRITAVLLAGCSASSILVSPSALSVPAVSDSS